MKKNIRLGDLLELGVTQSELAGSGVAAQSKICAEKMNPYQYVECTIKFNKLAYSHSPIYFVQYDGVTKKDILALQNMKGKMPL